MLKDIINEKWKEAFKARDLVTRSAYELIKQRIMLAEKSGKYDLPLTDEQILNLIVKECKEREELLTIYRPEDEQYIISECMIKELSQYLPKPLSEEEVIEIIKKHKAVESNIGKLIGLTAKEVGNRFGKSKIAALVKTV